MENIKKVEYNNEKITLITLYDYKINYTRIGYPKDFVLAKINDYTNYDEIVDIHHKEDKENGIDYKRDYINVYFKKENSEFMKNLLLEKKFIIENGNSFLLYDEISSEIKECNYQYGFEYVFTIKTREYFKLNKKTYKYSSFYTHENKIDIKDLKDLKKIDKSGLITTVKYNDENIYCLDYNLNDDNFDIFINHPDNTINLSSASRTRYESKTNHKINYDNRYFFIRFNDINFKIISELLNLKKLIIKYDNNIHLYDDIKEVKITSTDTNSNINLSLGIETNELLKYKDNYYINENICKKLSYKDIKF